MALSPASRCHEQSDIDSVIELEPLPAQDAPPDDPLSTAHETGSRRQAAAVPHAAPGDRIRWEPRQTLTGTNFALFSQAATAVQLLLFEAHDARHPVKVIDLDPGMNRTFYFWHIYVKDVVPGMGYAYRVDGPTDLHGRGHRFNPKKVLIDPYGRAVTSTLWDRAAACGPDDNVTSSLSSIVVDIEGYDWEGDQPAQSADEPDDHLRDARQGVHPVAVIGSETPGDLRGGHRADPLPQEPRDHRRRAHARLRIRRDGDFRDQPAHRPAARQLLGLQPDRLLQPARRLLHPAGRRATTSASSGTWSRPSTRPTSR